MIKLGRAARLWNGPSLRGHKWRNGAGFQNCLQTNAQQACRWCFKPFICEMRLREYSTLIDKGLDYFISVKLLILETIVSQRPWFNRIVEKLTYNRLIKYVEKLGLLDNAQYGFRSSSLATHAILDVLNTIQTNMDKKLFSCATFIDTVNHDVLLKMLYFYGIRGI